MITDERVAAFIESFGSGMTPYLEELEKTAVSSGIPIIRPQTRSILKYLLAEKEPENLLEIGTAVAFSAIFMATYGQPKLHIDTIENYEKRIISAKKNITAAGMDDKITLIEGDAQTVIEDMAREGRSYDMIFMDAAKAQYPLYLPVCRKLLRTGGILVSDNVLFDGDIVSSRFAVRRRDRTIHERMRQFLRDLTDDEGFVTTILPVGDGMTLSVRR